MFCFPPYLSFSLYFALSFSLTFFVQVQDCRPSHNWLCFLFLSFSFFHSLCKSGYSHYTVFSFFQIFSFFLLSFILIFSLLFYKNELLLHKITICTFPDNTLNIYSHNGLSGQDWTWYCSSSSHHVLYASLYVCLFVRE